MLEPSGAQWCARYPSSDKVEALAADFAARVARFIHELHAAGASVSIADTFRPPERAYLMHWCCMIGNGGQDPATVPAMAGVSIDWTCGGDRVRAKAAARAMMRGFQIAFPAALHSRHTQRLAIDMTIHWAGTITVRDARGVDHKCVKQDDLWPIGASFGVFKLVKDRTHWSSDGH